MGVRRKFNPPTDGAVPEEAVGGIFSDVADKKVVVVPLAATQIAIQYGVWAANVAEDPKVTVLYPTATVEITPEDPTIFHVP